MSFGGADDELCHVDHGCGGDMLVTAARDSAQ